MTTFTKSGFRDKFRGVMGAAYKGDGTSKPLDQQDLTLELAIVLKFYPDTYEALVQLRDTEKAESGDDEPKQWKVQIATPFVSNDIQILIIPDGEESTDAKTGERIITPAYEMAGLVGAIGGDYELMGGVLLCCLHMQDEAALYPEKDIVLIKNGDSTVILKQNSLNINAQHVFINNTDFAELIASLDGVLRNAEDSTINIQNDKISIDTPTLNIGENTSFTETLTNIQNAANNISIDENEINLNAPSVKINGVNIEDIGNGSSGDTDDKNAIKSIYMWSSDSGTFDVAQLQAWGVTDVLMNADRWGGTTDTTLATTVSRLAGTGIRVHAWCQIFHDGSGNFLDPADTTNQQNAIDFCVHCAGIAGVAGIHYDYVRYSGVAPNVASTQTPHGKTNIDNFMANCKTALKAANPNIIISASVMPEMSTNCDTYGQCYDLMDNDLDVVYPMEYFGNFNVWMSWQGTSVAYIKARMPTTKVVPALQGYWSDTTVVTKPLRLIGAEVRDAKDNGADGYAMFRYGYCAGFPNFNKDLIPSGFFIEELIDARILDTGTPTSTTMNRKIDGDLDNSYSIEAHLNIPSNASDRLLSLKPNNVAAGFTSGYCTNYTDASLSVWNKANITFGQVDANVANRVTLKADIQAARWDADTSGLKGFRGSYVLQRWAGNGKPAVFQGGYEYDLAANLTSMVLAISAGSMKGIIYLFRKSFK